MIILVEVVDCVNYIVVVIGVWKVVDVFCFFEVVLFFGGVYVVSI